MSNSKDIDKLLKDSTKKDNVYDLIVQLDKVVPKRDSFKPSDPRKKSPERDITSLYTRADLRHLRYLDDISKVDFSLHPSLFGSPGIPTEIPQSDFTYTAKRVPQGSNRYTDYTIPLFVLRFFFGLNTEKDIQKTQEAIVISNITGMEVFKHLSIPKHMLKADIDHKTIIKNICKYFKEYEDAMLQKNFIGPT